MIFEQPRHLNEVRYRRSVRIFRPALVVYFVLMPMVMYIALWSQVEIAEKVGSALFSVAESVYDAREE